MIYTNEPANVFYVVLSAHRGGLHPLDNASRHRRLVNSLRNAPGIYGVLETTDLSGCFREEGSKHVSEEQSMRVRCANKQQCLEVARLACNEYEQDCVLVYKSQTHTAGLLYAKGLDGYKAERLHGSFQQVDAPKGECYTVDEFGRTWEVVA